MSFLVVPIKMDVIIKVLYYAGGVLYSAVGCGDRLLIYTELEVLVLSICPTPTRLFALL